MPRESAEQKAARHALVEAYQESGQSYAEFASERNISPWKVRHALRKTESELGKPFAEVSAAAVAPVLGAGGDFRVTLRNGRELVIPAHFSEKRVRQLIGILETC